MKKTNWRSFEEACAYARQLQLKNQSEWRHWAKTEAKPDDIPAQPAHVYKDKGWSSWGEWLGTDYVANQNRTYLPYEEARTYVHQLQFKNGNEWAEWAKTKDKPDAIPAYPSNVYKDTGWQGMGDWLGNGKIANQNRTYLPYEEARNYVHQLQLKNGNEWAEWAKTEARPDDIPANPEQFYKKSDEWKGWGDWLGTGTVASYNRIFRPFEEARAFVHQLQLKNKDEWRNWLKTEAKPDDIPANPPSPYKDNGWQGWGDWLGTGKIANQNRVYLPYEEARAFVHSLQIKGETEWRNWLKDDNKPEDIPAQPSHVYKDKGWTGWGDWLGTGTIASYNRVFRPFEEARDFVHQLQLKNKDEWVDWAKTEAKPDDIPANPPSPYKDKGWLGWGDWLGIINRWESNAILSFLYSLKPVLESI